MKKKFLLSFFAVFAFVTSSMAQKVIKLTGDWDGDGKKEVASMTRTFDEEEQPEAPDIVRFSKSGIPSIDTQAYWCVLQNLGDLNGDKRDELGIIESGLNGTWGSYLIYSLKNNRWVVATKFTVKVDDMPDVPVKKISKGKIRITYRADDYNNKTKIVTIK